SSPLPGVEGSSSSPSSSLPESPPVTLCICMAASGSPSSDSINLVRIMQRPDTGSQKGRFPLSQLGELQTMQSTVSSGSEATRRSASSRYWRCTAKLHDSTPVQSAVLPPTTIHSSLRVHSAQRFFRVVSSSRSSSQFSWLHCSELSE